MACARIFTPCPAGRSAASRTTPRRARTLWAGVLPERAISSRCAMAAASGQAARPRTAASLTAPSASPAADRRASIAPAHGIPASTRSSAHRTSALGPGRAANTGAAEAALSSIRRQAATIAFSAASRTRGSVASTSSLTRAGRALASASTASALIDSTRRSWLPLPAAANRTGIAATAPRAPKARMASLRAAGGSCPAAARRARSTASPGSCWRLWRAAACASPFSVEATPSSRGTCDPSPSRPRASSAARPTASSPDLTALRTAGRATRSLTMPRMASWASLGSVNNWARVGPIISVPPNSHANLAAASRSLASSPRRASLTSGPACAFSASKVPRSAAVRMTGSLASL